MIDKSVSDAEIVKEVLEGNSALFEEIIERYKNLVFDVILKLVNNREEAEDLSQEAFLQAFKNLKKYNDSYSFRNWIYTITLNLTRNYIRRKKIISFVPFFGTEEPAALPEPSPAEGAIELTEKLLKALSGKGKELFILHYFKEESCRDIAEITGLSETNVKVILHRTRKKLFLKFGSADAGNTENI